MLLHPVSSTLRPDAAGAPPFRPGRIAAWADRGADPGPDVAVLITACDDVAAAVRGYGTVLPRARIFLYGDDPALGAVAEASGAAARRVAPSSRDALVRRMFAEVDADIYILAHGAGAADVCVAPLLVAEIDGGEKDLVEVSRFGTGPGWDAGDRLLARTVDFLFGRGGGALASDLKACSRRFVLSYRTAAPAPGRPSALDMTLHALRLRMPIGDVAALGGPPRPAGAAPARDLAGWIVLLGLVGRLLAEERPRRVFGLVGLAAVAAGIAAALPDIEVHGWRATLAPGRAALLSLALVASGGTVGAAGLLLDGLASARQEVRRLGTLAIPRRAERPGPQSSVS